MIKTEFAAIRFFHDNMQYTRSELPTNEDLQLKKITFGGVDRTWTTQKFNRMLAAAIDNKEYLAILFFESYPQIWQKTHWKVRLWRTFGMTNRFQKT